MLDWREADDLELLRLFETGQPIPRIAHYLRRSRFDVRQRLHLHALLRQAAERPIYRPPDGPVHGHVAGAPSLPEWVWPLIEIAEEADEFDDDGPALSAVRVEIYRLAQYLRAKRPAAAEEVETAPVAARPYNSAYAPSEDARLISMIRSGATSREVAAALGRTVGSVGERRRQLGVTKFRHLPPALEKTFVACVRAWHAEGLSLAEIARKWTAQHPTHARTAQHIGHCLAALGVDVRRRRGAAPAWG